MLSTALSGTAAAGCAGSCGLRWIVRHGVKAPASDRPSADIRLLGPVEVIGPGGRAVLPGSRQRALVGMLALQPGVIVGRSALIDALWGEEPPRTALKTLYSHVTRVRQALEACGLPDLLATREPGYALQIKPAETDAGRFELQLQQARAAGNPGDVAKQLREAMELWRGTPFADASLAGRATASIDRLEQLHIGAAEDLWAAELELGGHDRSVPELELLVASHPYRERLVGLLMLARYRSGRHADALAAYHQLRTRLADELGIDPGPELERRYTAILRHEPEAGGVVAAAPAFPRPAQLPAQAGHFTGRTQELSVLRELLATPGPRIVAVSGPGGMGKTSLALHWAHQVVDQFPDGQLFLDLRGQLPAESMDPAEAMPRLLRSLGVPSDRVPAELSEQAGLYRSLLAGKRLLVVLDNCGTVDQVLPLIPAGDESLLLITSRRRLTALATHHAVRLVDLDALDESDALALVGQMVGQERVLAEPEATAELLELCGRMPLALRIAAALLAAQPARLIRDLKEQLENEDRLDALSIEGDSRSVRAVFAGAYLSLSPAAARLFRLLGLHPGPTIALQLATAAMGVPARSAMTELVTAQLITALGDDRYRFHDLARLYAAECARLEMSPDEQQDTIDRILDWYLSVGEIANRTLDPNRNRVVPVVRHRPDDLPIAATDGHDAVLGFLDGERGNLVPLVRAATEHGRPTTAWQLTYLLTGFFEFRAHWTDRIEICRWAVTAAQADADEFAESLMLTSLGVAYNAAHRFAEAVEPLNRSLALAQAIDDVRGQGNANNNLAAAYVGMHRTDEAIDAFERSLALYTATGNTPLIAATLNNLGEMYIRTNRTDQGFEHLGRALKLGREAGAPWLEALICTTLGQAHLAGGDPAEAGRYLHQALEIRRQVGDQRFFPETLTYLGAARLALGDADGAIELLTEALTAGREINDEHLQASALSRLGQAHLKTGDRATAVGHLELALALRTRLPDPDEEAAIRRSLAQAAGTAT